MWYEVWTKVLWSSEYFFVGKYFCNSSFVKNWFFFFNIKDKLFCYLLLFWDSLAQTLYLNNKYRLILCLPSSSFIFQDYKSLFIIRNLHLIVIIQAAIITTPIETAIIINNVKILEKPMPSFENLGDRKQSNSYQNIVQKLVLQLDDHLCWKFQLKYFHLKNHPNEQMGLKQAFLLFVLKIDDNFDRH